MWRFLLGVLFSTLITGYTFYNLNHISTLVTPFNPKVLFVKESSIIARIFNIPQHLAESVYDVAVEEGLDPYLLAALIYTESAFRLTAVSPKGYYGLAQVPYRVPYAKANVLIGAKIFKEKLKLAKGDVKLALLYYKGYPTDSERGHQQVRKVLTIYQKAKQLASRKHTTYILF